jgi:hypothetical protein
MKIEVILELTKKIVIMVERYRAREVLLNI